MANNGSPAVLGLPVSAADMQAVLDKAASSPDPVIRGAAIRYKTLQAEFTSLEGFFEFYQREAGVFSKTGAAGKAVGNAGKAGVVGNAGKANGVEKVVSTAEATAKLRTSSSSSPGSRVLPPLGSATQFSERIIAVLKANGSPMKLSHLYEAYKASYEDPSLRADTFRQRLVKRRDEIALIEGRRYWPTGYPVPAGGDAEADEGDESVDSHDMTDYERVFDDGRANDVSDDAD